jgi:integrase
MQQRQASPHTISSYRDTFRQLLKFTEHRLHKAPSQLHFEEIEAPSCSAQIQRVLAIPSKRFTRTLVQSLARTEVDALLAAPDQRTWSGRRDHALILLAVQTGLRLSEVTGLKREDIILGTGAHVRVIGKGRKERCTPISRTTLAVLKVWLRDPQRGDGRLLFPSARVNGSAFMVSSIYWISIA